MAKVTMSRRSRVGRARHLKAAGIRGSIFSAGRRSDSSEQKSIEVLAAEQGIKPTRLEDILGKGSDLWESDQEFERFVEDIYARRREDRELTKP